MTSVAGAPSPLFTHLARLTDERGLFEHARYADPRPEHGYCVDDAARALVVIGREPRPDPTLRRLNRLYLDFVLDAVEDDGRCHNRMDRHGTWTDRASVGDWWGRAMWGLGVVVATGAPGAQARALAAFRLLSQQRSPDSRAMAFAAIGAAAVLGVRSDERSARDVLHGCAQVLRAMPCDDPWIWPEPRLRYANPVLAEALIVVGDVLADPDLQRRGLALLSFLTALQTRGGHLSLIPVAGRGPDDSGPGFDQQPIEAAALADASATAHRVTGDQRWLRGTALAWRWFDGENDSGTPMFDGETGGGYDGLCADGRNENQGAESTLAMLATAQQAARTHALR